jgi:hypothetical protein
VIEVRLEIGLGLLAAAQEREWRGIAGQLEISFGLLAAAQERGW